MPLTDRKPRGILRFGLRLPIFLYRAGLGNLLGNRFLLLTHIGRKSGRIHQTVIEVVRCDPSANVYIVASGWGKHSDWYRNLRQNPIVKIMAGNKNIPVQASFLNEEEGALELSLYARRHPLAFRELTYVMMGERLKGTDETCTRLAMTVPLVRFQPIRERNS